MLKASKLGVLAPALYFVDTESNSLFMEFVAGVSVKDHLRTGLSAAGAAIKPPLAACKFMTLRCLVRGPPASSFSSAAPRAPPRSQAAHHPQQKRSSLPSAATIPAATIPAAIIIPKRPSFPPRRHRNGRFEDRQGRVAPPRWRGRTRGPDHLQHDPEEGGRQAGEAARLRLAAANHP